MQTDLACDYGFIYFIIRRTSVITPATDSNTKKGSRDMMLHFNRCLQLFLTFLMVLVLCQPVLAHDEAKKNKKDHADEPWETAALYLGAFMTFMDTSYTLGTGGVSGKVDGEDALGLDETMTVFRVDAFWRITRRNRVDFTYYDLSRDHSKSTRFRIPDGKGGTIPVGTHTDTQADFRLYKLTYGYSFFKSEDVDLAAGLGVYVGDVDFKLQAKGFGKVNETQITVPVPAVNLQSSIAITPKWILQQQVNFFYLEIGEYTGKILDLNIKLDYNFWKYCGVGLGINFVYINYAEDKGGDEFLTEVEATYGGLLLYGKLYF